MKENEKPLTATENLIREIHRLEGSASGAMIKVHNLVAHEIDFSDVEEGAQCALYNIWQLVEAIQKVEAEKEYPGQMNNQENIS